jgi:uncharacterized membrane protein
MTNCNIMANSKKHRQVIVFSVIGLALVALMTARSLTIVPIK